MVAVQLYQRDLEKKMQMKGYAENKRYVKTSDIQIGDSVLVRRQAVNKASPLQVQYRKGTRVVAKRPDGSTITRATAHFKKVPFSSAKEAQRWSTSEWPTGPVSESTLSTGDDGCPGVEQSDETTTGMGADEPIHAEVVTPTRLQSLPVCKEGLRRSERYRKDRETYLKEKYPDFQL